MFRSHSAVDLGGHCRKHSPEEGLLGRTSADLEYKRPKQNLILMLNAFFKYKLKNFNLVLKSQQHFFVNGAVRTGNCMVRIETEFPNTS